MEHELEMGILSRHIGQQVEAWGDGHCRLAIDIDERHANRDGAVDGGVIAILIDSAAAYAGTYPAEDGRAGHCATIAMNINFIAQPQGKRLLADGKVRGGGKRIFFARTEITDELGNLVAYGDCTFRYFPPAD